MINEDDRLEPFDSITDLRIEEKKEKPQKKIWECKIGEIDAEKLPRGADAPMRQAIEKAYFELTGEYPDFIFSGWGGQLNKMERAV